MSTENRLENHQVLLRPLVTEKGIERSEKLNQYTFQINTSATKEDVKRAVEEYFNVKVAKVCTQNRLGKQRRFRFKLGKTKNWKKAIVTLSGDYRIDFF